jgi:hypothetical protein
MRAFAKFRIDEPPSPTIARCSFLQRIIWRSLESGPFQRAMRIASQHDRLIRHRSACALGAICINEIKSKSHIDKMS